MNRRRQSLNRWIEFARRRRTNFSSNAGIDFYWLLAGDAISLAIDPALAFWLAYTDALRAVPHSPWLTEFSVARIARLRLVDTFAVFATNLPWPAAWLLPRRINAPAVWGANLVAPASLNRSAAAGARGYGFARAAGPVHKECRERTATDQSRRRAAAGAGGNRFARAGTQRTPLVEWAAHA
jgi:hypothetical protein